MRGEKSSQDLNEFSSDLMFHDAFSTNHLWSCNVKEKTFSPYIHLHNTVPDSMITYEYYMYILRSIH